MTRNIFIVAAFLLALMAPAFASAAEFTATVESNHAIAGEGFSLQLTLSGASAKDGGPDISALQQSFTVASEAQTSSTTFINGSVKSSIGWELTLIPRKGGHVQIPSVSIDTDAGVLKTQPIALEVESAAAQSGHASGQDMISITAKVDEKAPYRNQPVSYTVTVIAHANIANVSLEDLAVDHAIVQKQGKPEIYDRVENGRPAKVIEFHYLITPLTSQKMTIPSVILQGNVEVQEDTRRRNPFNNGMMDPFQMMRNLGSFDFSSYRPFSIESNAVELDVKPPAVEMDPWLPLRSLQVQGKMETQQAKVGEPLTRKLVLLADGAVGSQLPSLEAQQNRADFKVYGDKPTIGEDVNKKTGAVSGWRRESYSLIPQKAGKLVLPEIKIPWWDIANNKVAYATLPEETVEVLPGAGEQTQNAPVTPSETSQPPVTTSPVVTTQPFTPQPRSYALYAIVALLAFGFLVAVFWAFSLQRKIGRMKAPAAAENKPAGKKAVAPKSAANSDLSQVKTAQELSQFIQTYAHEQRGTEKNAALEDIFAALKINTPEANALVREITAALYGGRAIADMENLKERCNKVLASIRTDKKKKEPGEKLQSLNPS